MKRIFLTYICLFLLSGCSAQSLNSLKLHVEGSLIDVSYDIVDQLLAETTFPLIPGDTEQAILIATPVNNNDFSKVSDLGRLLQDQIASRFVQQQFAVKEINLQDSLDIRPQHGETILSRDTERLTLTTNAQAIFVSTLSQAGDILYINARLVDPRSGSIISATDKKLVMNSHTQRMLKKHTAQNLHNPQTNFDTNPVAEPKPPFMNSILY